MPSILLDAGAVFTTDYHPFKWIIYLMTLNFMFYVSTLTNKVN